MTKNSLQTPHSRKRNGASAQLESPGTNLSPPTQTAAAVQEAINAANNYCATANSSDPAANVIKLLSLAVSLLLEQNQRCQIPAADTLSATELERKRSVVIAGLPEQTGTVSNVVRNGHDVNSVYALVDHLQPPDRTTPAPEVAIVAAYRMGKTRADGHPRLLKVVFATRGMQLSVLSASKHLCGHNDYQGVFVRPSLTQEERAREFKLREELRTRRASGEKNIRIRGGQIVSEN